MSCDSTRLSSKRLKGKLGCTVLLLTPCIPASFGTPSLFSLDVDVDVDIEFTLKSGKAVVCELRAERTSADLVVYLQKALHGKSCA